MNALIVILTPLSSADERVASAASSLASSFRNSANDVDVVSE
jgi:hypothetical protein